MRLHKSIHVKAPQHILLIKLKMIAAAGLGMLPAEGYQLVVANTSLVLGLLMELTEKSGCFTCCGW